MRQKTIIKREAWIEYAKENQKEHIIKELPHEEKGRDLIIHTSKINFEFQRMDNLNYHQYKKSVAS